MKVINTETTKPIVSIITVVYNDRDNIEATIRSALSQINIDIDYIVIDGGSKDGTKEIIERYSEQMGYWVSEPDKGIYDAMNKGISHASGQWICFLNSGDYFVKDDSLFSALNACADKEDIDVIYGDSKEFGGPFYKDIISDPDPSKLEFHPTYRHGSSLVRSDIQKQFLFDTSKKNLGYALDWEMIHRLYETGHKFKKVDVFLEAYNINGTSNHQYRNRWNNYLITSNGNHRIAKLLLLIKGILYVFLKESVLYKWLRAFVLEYITNGMLPHLPFWWCRKKCLQLIGAKIGKGSFIMRKNYFIDPNRVHIGENSHINQACLLDARGNIIIGNNVSISHDVKIMTGGHDINSPYFTGIFKSIIIKDYAWLGVGCTILQGCEIGRGAVVCAGAVVTHDVADYEIVAGIPAKCIGQREQNLKYHCKWDVPFT
jgi:acetyltransferase-like isoleucine patch superfamily enzyme